MKISPATLRRLAKLEADKPGDVGQWVRNCAGELVWDPWNPTPTPEEAAATMASVMREMDQIAARLQAQPGWKEPTAAEKAQLDRDMEARFPGITGRAAATPNTA
jgi:hypothetical protein